MCFRRSPIEWRVPIATRMHVSTSAGTGRVRGPRLQQLSKRSNKSNFLHDTLLLKSHHNHHAGTNECIERTLILLMMFQLARSQSRQGLQARCQPLLGHLGRHGQNAEQDFLREAPQAVLRVWIYTSWAKLISSEVDLVAFIKGFSTVGGGRRDGAGRRNG